MLFRSRHRIRLQAVHNRRVPLRTIHPKVTIAAITMSTAHSIQEQTTIINTVAPFARNGDSECRLGRIHARSETIAGLGGPVTDRVGVGLAVEREVRVRVEDESVCAREVASPC